MGTSYSMAEAVRIVFDKWPVGHEFYGTDTVATRIISRLK